jgi:hypothetical protein
MIKTLFAGLLLCLCALGAAGPSRAQADRDAGNDPLLRLQREGWGIVQDGVLRRQPQPDEVETFVYGVEGFTWKLRDLQALRRAIASHRKAIASTRKMIERARAAEVGAKWDIWSGGCNLNFAYDAEAAHKVNLRGVWSVAGSDFNASESCPYGGEVYAYAFAKTTVNGAPTTATVTDGPRSGPNVSASADASRNGGAPCESYAYSSVTSNSLSPSSYSKSKLSETCPAASTPATLQVSLTSDHAESITIWEEQCETVTWTVNISGGTPPYTASIYRDGVFQRTGTSYSEQFCFDQAREENFEEFQDVAIQVYVTDSGGQSKSASGGIGILYRWWIY